MNKKNLKLIIIPLAILVLIVIIINLQPKYKLDNAEKERIKKEVINNADTLSNEAMTIEKLKEIVGEDSINVLIAVGEDSYLRNKPTQKVLTKYNLRDLETRQDELVSKVEERYLNNLEYQVVGEEIDGNSICEVIEIKTYYYALYLNDYINLTNKLNPNSLEDVTENDESAVEYYKAQLKALEVLNNHLDDYENTTNEKETIRVCYKNGKVEDHNQMLSLNLALQGEMYENMNANNPDNVKASNDRLEKYTKEAENIS